MKTWVWWIVGILGVLLVAGGAAVWYYSNAVRSETATKDAKKRKRKEDRATSEKEYSEDFWADFP